MLVIVTPPVPQNNGSGAGNVPPGSHDVGPSAPGSSAGLLAVVAQRAFKQLAPPTDPLKFDSHVQENPTGVAETVPSDTVIPTKVVVNLAMLPALFCVG